MKRIRNLPFRIKLVFAICLVNLIVIICITLLNYQWDSRQLILQTQSQTQQLIEQAGINIDTYFDELYRLTLTPYYNDELMAMLDSTPETPSEVLNAKRTVEDFLASVMTLPKKEVLRVYIMNESYIYEYKRTPYEMSEYTTYLESDWYQEAQSTLTPIFVQPHMEKVYGEKGTPVFSIVRILRSKEDNSKLLGVIKVDADFTAINTICDQAQLSYSGKLFIINDASEILYQSTTDIPDIISFLPDNTGSSIISVSGSRYLINRYNIGNSGISIIALHSYEEMMQPLRSYLLRSLIISVSCILISAILFVFIIRMFMKPLFNIIELMKRVEAGDLCVTAQVTTHDEIGFLAESFNNMTLALQQTMEKNTLLVKEIYEAQFLAKESQYNALCNQIKPHFLYNTLNTISLLVKCNENAEAVRAIENFSFYLTGIMNADREITLDQELQICQAYLNIITLRYHERLSYQIDVNKLLYKKSIPALTIQPLIENAVKYACEPSRKHTIISISSETFDASYKIIVSDNGPGMSKETLDRIYQCRCEADSSIHSAAQQPLAGNIGLINIYKRLHLKYGNLADLQIYSSTEGTSVEIIMPL